MTPTEFATTISLAAEVTDALSAGRPVVALESAIITHGLPRPVNLETARSVAQTVRTHGAIPATIAVIDGVPTVGLTPNQLETLAADTNAKKASVRDLPILGVTGASAGMTVAATMRIAAMAGIGVFATGGLGGVHRGATQSFDISADLGEFVQSPVAVVCAGVKSILDIPKTLELLETLGVPLVGYGTDEFPAFFCRSSGCAIDHRVDAVADIARIIQRSRDYGRGIGMIVANPIPEPDSLPATEIASIIDEAVSAADQEGIAGKALTPFLLDRVNRATAGRSLTANLALVHNNATLAARISVALTN